jgi:hypothetical protein
MLMVTPVDVQPVVVVQRALKMFENEIQNADIEMDFIVDESLKRLNLDWVRVDPQRVLQVWTIIYYRLTASNGSSGTDQLNN